METIVYIHILDIIYDLMWVGGKLEPWPWSTIDIIFGTNLDVTKRYIKNINIHQLPC